MDDQESQLLRNVDENSERYQDSTEGDGSVERSVNNTFSYEVAIAKTGYGWFHYQLLILCGWTLCSDAIEVLAISFILPPATCDLHLSSQTKGLVTSIIFVGMMIGGYMWGVLADIYGRRSVLLYSLTLNGIGGLCSSIVQDYPLFLFFRFISGIGVGGSLPVVFAYYTEFQPKDKRGKMISMLATFWMSGNIIAAALAWLVIPNLSWGIMIGNFKFESWRIFLALCTIPCLTAAIGFGLSPESPKFLMQKGNHLKALMILRKMFKRNNPKKNVNDHFQVEQLEYFSEYSELSVERTISNEGCCSTGKIQIRNYLKKFFKTTISLYSPPLTRVSIILTIIYFTLSFGYYGMFLWFPELFSRMDKYGGSLCSVAEPNSTDVFENSTCTYDNDNSIYFEGFITALSNLPGNIITILIIDKIGRRWLLCGSMMISGLSIFLITVLKSQTQNLIMSCIFGGISVIGWNALDVIGMELFPTDLRSTANGVTMGVGRIGAILGNLAFGELVDFYCLVPLFTISGFLTIGGISALKLPSTRDIDLL